MTQTIKRIFCFSLAVLFVLSACAPAPAPAPTQDPALNELLQKVDSLIATQNIPPTQDPALEELKQQVQILTEQQQALNEALLNPADAEEASPEAPDAAATEAPAAAATLAVEDCGDADILTPVILRVDQEQGENYGGKSITIAGMNLVYLCGTRWTNTRFLFGSEPATDIVCESAELCTLKSPPALDKSKEAPVAIRADNNGVQSEEDFTFTYLVPPTVEEVDPNSGSIRGGRVVIITGEGFIEDETKFLFGEEEAQVISCIASECRVVSPALTNNNQDVVVWVRAVNGSAYSEMDLSEDTGQTFKYLATPKYACDAFTVVPKENTSVGPGDGFKVRWIVRNIGTSPWPAGQDLRFSGGVNMGEISFYEIGHSLQPNDSVTIEFNATAPTNPGLYYMNWMVAGQGCSLYVSIRVSE